MAEVVGKVIQVMGPVIDVQFEGGHVPAIYNAIRVTSEGFDSPFPIDNVLEVAQHLGGNAVKCIAMQPTDGMVRGMKAIDTGAPITVPVGRETLGRVLNVLGEPVDQQGEVKAKKTYPIHRPAPSLTQVVKATGRPGCRAATCSRPQRMFSPNVPLVSTSSVPPGSSE